jgi:hypothetical protein
MFRGRQSPICRFSSETIKFLCSHRIFKAPKLPLVRVDFSVTDNKVFTIALGSESLKNYSIKCETIVLCSNGFDSWMRAFSNRIFGEWLLGLPPI